MFAIGESAIGALGGATVIQVALQLSKWHYSYLGVAAVTYGTLQLSRGFYSYLEKNCIYLRGVAIII